MEGPLFKTTTRTSKIYSLKAHIGLVWGDISIDTISDSVSRIVICSDYGNWQYSWGSFGKDGFKKFLVGLNMQYLANKFGEDKFYDKEATINNYRTFINDNYESDEQRERLLRMCNELEKECNNQNSLVMQLMGNYQELLSFFDGRPEICHRISPSFVKFYETIWKEFCDQLKIEIDEEAH